MKKLLIALLLVAGCVSTPPLPPSPIIPTPEPEERVLVKPETTINMGAEVPAPWGFDDLCRREPNAPECGK